MHRTLLRYAFLILAAPLALSACKDPADPVKPKVAASALVTPAG